jgi:hypothetical protein
MPVHGSPEIFSEGVFSSTFRTPRFLSAFCIRELCVGIDFLHVIVFL